MDTISQEVLHDLAPGGAVRVALNFGNPVLVRRDTISGEPKGITVDLARELARRLGVPPKFIAYEGAGKVVAALPTQAWDVAFMAIDPQRAEQLLFTPPYVIIEGTYLVRADSPYQHVDDLDRHGVRIAVGKGAAYDLFLSRTLKNASLVRAETSAAVIDLFLAEELDAAAGIRQPLVAAAREHSAWRVIPGRFMAIEQAMCTPAGRNAGRQFLVEFIADMKTSGFVAEALARYNERDALVAP